MSQYTIENTSRTVNIGTGTMHYHEAGSGPVLILLHGSGPGVNGWANFGGNLDWFAPHFRCLVPDLPGYGKSDPVEGYPIPATIDAVLRYMDAMGIEKAHIIGNSYGGIVGAQLAAKAPERVDRLVCIGGIGVNIFSTFPGEGLTRLVDFIEDPTRERITAWLQSMVYDPAIVTEELIDMRFKQATDPMTMATSKQLYTRQALAGIAAMQRGPDAVQGFAYLPKVQAPTLLAWGRDDRVNPLDGAMLPMRLIPNCELHVFPKCGHWAMIERRAEFQTVSLEFLTRG
ncbi:alpha/beta fold hydrolase [Flavisphingomonas formosensis]|uniref:alpha/beta fold hydrolase n=1 Tax=Flavisphingomonas formosensis TaxID=861534 RepID=UPI0012FC6D2B|nr:alpha/beta fold hydrolase [Sphingomonas formosensis]